MSYDTDRAFDFIGLFRFATSVFCATSVFRAAELALTLVRVFTLTFSLTSAAGVALGILAAVVGVGVGLALAFVLVSRRRLLNLRGNPVVVGRRKSCVGVHESVVFKLGS